MDMEILKTELSTDPLSRGYASMSDEEAATDLNTLNISRNRTSMTGREVADEIVDAEYDVLSEDEKTQVLALVASDTLDPFGFGANVIKDIFGVGSDTVAALASARVETISRATELGLGVVKVGWIIEARR